MSINDAVLMASTCCDKRSSPACSSAGAMRLCTSRNLAIAVNKPSAPPPAARNNSR
jgi:hypothetical protein